ncbi:MSMEG_0565 family glycosyltransferase [Nocardioides mangrovicus]|uniref:MSMEG_0565 family glycosyltransferase n=1 Tax=Nocardioides mangrovicus TaxID=2478913 RepID=A0A3L8P744_9ACTN|nr:MSMEG_0565 family glycosyltransferase [Nocardioides mangrovicus]RLV50553.1 MSMEG_0565 family glycosyltransferase [Nocardioides mangrovicus]
MRLALLTYSTRPRGGVVHTLALAEALAAKGVEVDVWTLAREGDQGFFRPVDPTVGVVAVPFAPDDAEPVGARIVRSIAVLREAFAPARAGYDVVHAQDCISANAALPCVRTIHHLDTFTTPELAACHERAVVAPRQRICVSAAVADEVRQGWGLTPTVIPNGVDAARFEHGAADRAGRDRWSARLGRYVLALGGIEPRKGSLDLLEAFALLRARRPELRLVIGGGETLFDYRDYRARYEQRAAELGVEPVVLGTLTEDELPSLVAQADALAMVSTKEGFGLAAMEALAAGTPVVARDLPVLREVFGDTVGYGTDPASFARLLDAATRTEPDPGPGRLLARRFTWRRAAQAHLDFYAAHP